MPETAQFAEAAVLTGFGELAGLLYEQLRPYAHRCCVEGIAAACTGSVAWYLAMLARFLGHPQDAKTYDAQAVMLTVTWTDRQGSHSLSTQTIRGQ